MQAAAHPFTDIHTAADPLAAALPHGPLCGSERRNSPWP